MNDLLTKMDNNRLWMRVKAVLIILALVAIGLGLLWFKGCLSKKQVTKTYRDVKAAMKDSTQYYKDVANREHASRMQVEAERDVIDAYYGEIIDSLAEANNIKAKQIETFALIGTIHSDEVAATVDTVLVDSGKAVRIRYSDEWVNITGIASKKKATINYSIKDSLAFTTHWKRSWFWGRKTTYIDVYSLNPKVTITGLQGVKIADDRRQPFGISAYVGYGYNGAKLQPSIGLALTYDLIKF